MTKNKSTPAQGTGSRGLRLLGAAALLGLLPPTVTVADTLYLKNGQKLEGVVLSESEGTITFQDSSRVVLRLKREQVDRVEQGTTALGLEDSADAAFANGDFDRALELYQEALAQGASTGRIRPKIEQTRRNIVMRDLGRYANEIAQVRENIEEGNLERAKAQINVLSAVTDQDEALSRTLPILKSNICYKQALQLLDSVNYVEAEKQLRQALEFDPSNANACVELARITAQIARTREEAVHYYKQALKNAGDRLTEQDILDAKYSLGRLYASLGKHEEARPYYQKVYETAPKFRNDLEEMFVVSLKEIAKGNELRHPEKSVEAYRAAIVIRPFDSELRSRLAASLVATGEYDEAIEHYTELLESGASVPNLNQKLAAAFTQKGEYEMARDQLRHEVERNPQNYSAFVDLGDILVRMGDFDQARDEYLKARAIDSLDPRATISLARAERLLGNYEEARKYAREILAIRPDDPRVVLEMGMINKDDKKFDDALVYLERTMKLINEGKEEDKIIYRQLLADACIASGEVKLLTRGPATATEDFNNALKVYPNYPSAYFNIGAAYQKKYNSSKLMEDLIQAEQNMKKARELQPENPEFAFGLGVLYHQVLASADPANQQKYLAQALENYKAYLEHGGAEVTKVESWIGELN